MSEPTGGAWLRWKRTCRREARCFWCGGPLAEGPQRLWWPELGVRLHYRTCSDAVAALEKDFSRSARGVRRRPWLVLMLADQYRPKDVADLPEDERRRAADQATAAVVARVSGTRARWQPETPKSWERWPRDRRQEASPHEP